MMENIEVNDDPNTEDVEASYFEVEAAIAANVGKFVSAYLLYLKLIFFHTIAFTSYDIYRFYGFRKGWTSRESSWTYNGRLSNNNYPEKKMFKKTDIEIEIIALEKQIQ